MTEEAPYPPSSVYRPLLLGGPFRYWRELFLREFADWLTFFLRQGVEVGFLRPPGLAPSPSWLPPARKPVLLRMCLLLLNAAHPINKTSSSKRPPQPTPTRVIRARPLESPAAAKVLTRFLSVCAPVRVGYPGLDHKRDKPSDFPVDVCHDYDNTARGYRAQVLNSALRELIVVVGD